MPVQISREEQRAALEGFNRYVITQARANLTRGDSNVSRKLYDSLKGEVEVGPNSIRTSISMEEHGKYVDKGVKGAQKSAKAPNSPYKFGTGTGRKGGLTEGILQWVRARRIQFKDKRSKKFYSYEATAALITRSVYLNGMKPKYFISKPIEVAYEKLPAEIVEAYGLDLETLYAKLLDAKIV